MKTLSINHETVENVSIVILEGLLNADTSPGLEETLQELTDVEIPNILLNMERLTYISSAGIGCFIGAIKNIRNKGGDIRFSNVNNKVKRVFDLLDMGDFFQFFPTQGEGITSYQ